MFKLIHPAYFLTVECKGQSWVFSYGRVFYRDENATMKIIHREQEYGLTKEKIVIELFRVGAGKEGHYLVNLRDKQYYYCGVSLEDVKAVLQELGIGRLDPVEG